MLSLLLDHPGGSDEFTESLQQALVDYQNQNGLMVTGVTDEETWIALFGECLLVEEEMNSLQTRPCHRALSNTLTTAAKRCRSLLNR